MRMNADPSWNATEYSLYIEDIFSLEPTLIQDDASP
jgi:hypothetical protein